MVPLKIKGKKGMLDKMNMKHLVDDSKITYYNLVEL